MSKELAKRPYWFILFETTGVIYYIFVLIFSIYQLLIKTVLFSFLEFLISFSVAICVADILSGLIHYFADNIGDETTPILGAAIIRPFREHHIVPKKMTEHDFIETNGSLYLICGILLNLSIYFNQQVVFFMILTVFLANTNQIHKLAHMNKVPRPIILLRKFKLVISPQEHDKHHSKNLNSHYCITTGWFNKFLFNSSK